MKFFGMDEKAAISSMEDRRKGCYPIGNNGIWHAGQHIYFGKENAMIENPVTGIMVAGNFSSDKKWNYIVLENDIRFPHQKEADNGFHCYNVISNIRAKNGYDNLIGAESDITKEVLEKIKELPFYVTVQLKLPKNTCTDKYNYKSVYSNLGRTVLKETLTAENKISGLCADNLTAADDWYHITADADIFSQNNKKLGKVKKAVTAGKGTASENYVKIKCRGEDIDLCGIESGLYVFEKEDKVNEFGNVILDDKTKLVLWEEKNREAEFPGFGIVIDRKNKKIRKILINTEFSEEFSECKRQLEELLNSEDTENGCIYVISETERKDVYPYYFMNKAEESFKITDKGGNIIKPLRLKDADYDRLTKFMTGFLKYADDWWKTASDLWIESGLKCSRMKKTDVSGVYGSFFDCVKLQTESGTGLETYDITKSAGLFAKVKPYCILGREYEIYVNKKDIYEKVLNVSDKRLENMYKFAVPAEVRKGIPCADAVDTAQGVLEIDNIKEIAEALESKKAYVWARSGNSYIYVRESVIGKLKIKLIKKEPEKGDIIPAGAKLGFACNGEEAKANVISEKKPYVDYALFFTEDITGKNTRLEKIELAKGLPCLKEKTTFTETEAQILIPPKAEMIKKEIEGNNGYCELKKVLFSVCVYPDHVENGKLSSKAKTLWIYNFPVSIEEGQFSSIGSEGRNYHKAEKNKSRIDLIKDLVDSDVLNQIKGKTLQAVRDFKGNPMYEYVVEKKYNKIIEKSSVKDSCEECQYVKTYIKKTEYESVLLPVDFKRIGAAGNIEKITESGKSYIKMQINGDFYFIEETVVKQNTENLLSEFMENCQTVNFGKNPIAGKDICPEDKLYIEQNNRNHNMDAFKKKLRERLLLIKDEKGNNLEGCIPDPDDEKETSIGIYKEGMAYQHLMHTYLKKTVSKHPLEWDEQLLKPACASRGIRPFSGADDNDIFKDISKEKKELKTNSFYFASPIYFYSRMDELGLMFRNPYEGLHFSMNGISVTCDSSPGFAPYTKNSSYGGYAAPNGLFNEDYSAWNNKYKKYYHDGIDLAAVKGTPIHSLIYGKVIAKGVLGTEKEGDHESGSYGRILLIKQIDNNTLFLLAHIDQYAEGVNEQTEIYPGMTVAYVGNTGNSYGNHLHVTVLETDIDRKDKIFDGTYDLIWNRKFNQAISKRDPLKHTIKWILPQ